MKPHSIKILNQAKIEFCPNRIRFRCRIRLKLRNFLKRVRSKESDQRVRSKELDNFRQIHLLRRPWTRNGTGTRTSEDVKFPKFLGRPRTSTSCGGLGGSNFWSSKACEGGESREVYGCRLTFGPPKFLFEINDHVTQFVRKPTFGPLSN